MVSLARAAAAASVLFVITTSVQGAAGGRAFGFWDILGLPRHWMSAVFAFVGLVLLMRARFTRNLRLLFLPVVFFVFSIAAVLPLGRFAVGMGLHPSPYCIMTKPFLFLRGGMGVPLLFWVSLLVVGVLTVIGNKLFCGWVCPVGAIQELVNRIPLPARLKVKVPFRVTNSVRVGVYALFLVLVLSAGAEIYEYFNPFEALHWGFERTSMAVLAGTLAAGLFLWRPFCYFLCPLGLLTWLLEQLSLVRIRTDKSVCRDCDRCVKESPCLAISSVVEGKRLRPDCFSCGLCLEVCRKNALSYRR